MTQLTRRNLLRVAGATGIASVGLNELERLLVPTVYAQATNQLSNCVIKDSTCVFARRWNDAQVGPLRSDQYIEMGDVTKILFDHIDESGTTQNMVNYYRQNRNTILGYVFTPANVDPILSHITGAGANMTAQELCAVLNGTPSGRTTADSQIMLNGFTPTEQLAVQTWYNLAALGNARASADACTQFRAVIDTVELVAAANGVGCVAGCAPCCGIAAGAGLVAVLLEIGYHLTC